MRYTYSFNPRHVTAKHTVLALLLYFTSCCCVKKLTQIFFFFFLFSISFFDNRPLTYALKSNTQPSSPAKLASSKRKHRDGGSSSIGGSNAVTNVAGGDVVVGGDTKEGFVATAASTASASATVATSIVNSPDAHQATSHSFSDQAKHISTSRSENRHRSETATANDNNKTNRRTSLSTTGVVGTTVESSNKSRSLSQDSLLHTFRNPQTPPTNPRTIEAAAVWDWELPNSSSISSDRRSAGGQFLSAAEPLTTATQTTGLFTYEPQGELLNERADRGVASKEFSIPDPVGVTISNPLEALLAGGVKRKAALDSDRANLETRKKPAFSNMVEENSTSTRGDGARQRDRRTLPPAGDISSSSVASSATSLALPARKVFPIQIGDKLFRLSGASISSDGESRLETR